MVLDKSIASGKEPLNVSWFSAGVSSAVAIKLAMQGYEIDHIFYIHIEDQHRDTLRFVIDCEKWFGQKIEVLQSPKYKSVEQVVRACIYINGPSGAPCTTRLKRWVRKAWERKHNGQQITYVWGLDINERDRADHIESNMSEQSHIFPLLERKLTKQAAHEILKASGIKRPAMYNLGYHNNNCIGCVRGGMGYWNKIRVDFPDVFASRAKLERFVGASCIKGVYLDELDPKRGRHEGPIVDDCGIMCEVIAL
jgi:hypothetical protein